MEGQKRASIDGDSKVHPISKRLKVIPPRIDNTGAQASTLTVDVDIDQEFKDAELIKEDDKSSVLDDKKRKVQHLQLKKVLSKMNLDFDKVSKLIADARERKVNSIVLNDQRLTSAKRSNYLGHIVYTGAQSNSMHLNDTSDLDLFVVPVLTEKEHYCTLQVRIPCEFLSYRSNIALRNNAIWGTDIYTDDSDPVAIVIHSGHYTLDSNDNSSILIEDSHVIKNPGYVAKIDTANSSENTMLPDHDLYVTLLVLPRLLKYTGSSNCGLDSKYWGPLHDGESLRVEKVETVPRGSARKSLRKSISNQPSLKNSMHSDSFSSTFMSDGTYKYSLSSLINWPSYLCRILDHGQEMDERLSDELAIFKYEELLIHKNLPFWQLKLLKQKLSLQSDDGKRFSEY